MATIATELIDTKPDERGRQIRPAHEREALVRAYRRSGLTQKAFAEREGIKYTTFVSWIQGCAHQKGVTSQHATSVVVQFRDPQIC